MKQFLQGFLDNDSVFGRLMTRFGIVIGANLMFVFFSLPVVTIGASYVALYHVMLKTLRGDGVLNPFVHFWQGFKSNFKQATIYWVIFLALFAFGYVDVRFCQQMGGGVLQYFLYALYAMGIIVVTVTVFLFPVMAAFADTIPHLIRNAVYFALQKPFRLMVMLFFNVFPLYLTYTDPQMMPLYGFMWVMFGYGAIALLGAKLLLPSFQVYLPPVDAVGMEAASNVEQMPGEKKGKTLKEMKKLGM